MEQKAVMHAAKGNVGWNFSFWYTACGTYGPIDVSLRKGTRWCKRCPRVRSTPRRRAALARIRRHMSDAAWWSAMARRHEWMP